MVRAGSPVHRYTRVGGLGAGALGAVLGLQALQLSRPHWRPAQCREDRGLLHGPAIPFHRDVLRLLPAAGDRARAAAVPARGIAADHRPGPDRAAVLFPWPRPGFLRARPGAAHPAAPAPAPGLPGCRTPPPTHPPPPPPADGPTAPGGRPPHQPADRAAARHLRGTRAQPPGEHLRPAERRQPHRRHHPRVPGPGRHLSPARQAQSANPGGRCWHYRAWLISVPRATPSWSPPPARGTWRPSPAWLTGTGAWSWPWPGGCSVPMTWSPTSPRRRPSRRWSAWGGCAPPASSAPGTPGSR